MFLNAESVGAEIVTAKSSEMNVMIPNGEDFVEQPLPEQFKTVISGSEMKIGDLALETKDYTRLENEHQLSTALGLGYCVPLSQ